MHLMADSYNFILYSLYLPFFITSRHSIIWLLTYVKLTAYNTDVQHGSKHV